MSVLQKYDVLDGKKSYTIENTKVSANGNVIQNSDATGIKQISENAKKLLEKQ